MSFWPFAPASFWATFDSFFEKYQNNMLDVYWSRRLKICLRLRIPHYGICVKLAEAGFYCLLWFFCFSPRFFLFFFILGMTLSSQLSLYDKGINPFFQLDRVMWFEGWSEGWQQTWTTEIFWDWIEKKRSRLSSWHCGTWTISAAGFANSLAGWANCHIGKGRRSNRKYWWLISLSLR